MMQDLVGKRVTRPTKFMAAEIKIQKLSVSEVMEIQEFAESVSKSEEGAESGFNLLKNIIRRGVEGAASLTDQDFDTFPMDELAKLSNEIMKFSGLDQEKGKQS